MARIYKTIYLIIYEKRSLFNRLLSTIKTRIKRDRYRVLINSFIENHQYKEAANAIEKNNLQKKGDYQRLYAYCLQTYRASNSNAVMRDYLESTYDIDLGRVFDYLSETIPCKKENIEYKFNGGLGNLGALIIYGEFGKPVSIIKILDAKKQNNEVVFYDKIQASFPSIFDFIPKYQGTYCFEEKIQFLATEYVCPQTTDESCDVAAIEAVEKMSSIKPKELKEVLPHIRFYNGNSEIERLHRKIALMMIKEQIDSTLAKTPDASELRSRLEDAITSIIDNKINKRLKPSVHYSLCHNDFHRKNIFALNDGQIKAFDWNNYRFGIIGWDLAYYWGNFEKCFRSINIDYIEREINLFPDKHSWMVWKVFFILCLLYVWVARLHNNSCKPYNEEFFLPAYIELRNTVNELVSLN